MADANVFSISLACINLLLLLSTKMVEESGSTRPAINAARLYFLINAASWIIDVVAGMGLVMQLAGLYLTAISSCCIHAFCTRRAGNGTHWRYLGLVLILICSAYTETTLEDSMSGFIHTSTSSFLMLLPYSAYCMLRVKPVRTRSDILLGVTLMVMIGFGVARSAMILVSPTVFAGTGSLYYIVWPVTDVAFALFVLTGYTEEAYWRMRTLALRDALTGLLNRRGYAEQAISHFAHAERSGLPMTAAMIDIDHFKAINDRHGHDVGDAAIRRLADIISRTMRDGDLVARFGGEEFLVLLPYLTQADAIIPMERVRDELRESFATGADGEPQFTVSIGIASRLGGGDGENLIKVADDALYQAKHNGRNRIELAATI